MTEMILNTCVLPEPLFELIHTETVKVCEVDGIISLVPIEEVEPIDYIAKLRGSCADGKLTVEKFLAQKHTNKELER